MGSPRLNPNSLRLAVASVFAFFGFLVAFFIVSDRLGGWPLGYVVAGLIAVTLFLVILMIVPRFGLKSATATARAEGRRPSLEPKRSENIVKERPTPRATLEPPRVPAARVVRPTPEVETIFDDIVEVRSGREGCWDYELPLEVGDKLRVTLREVDGYDFGWMIMPGEDLAGFLNGNDIATVDGEENVKAASFEWEQMGKGPRHLVLEAYGKQYTREIRVVLRRVC